MLKAKIGERVCWLVREYHDANSPATSEIMTGELQGNTGTYLPVWPDGAGQVSYTMRGDLYRITPTNVTFLKALRNYENARQEMEWRAGQEAHKVRQAAQPQLQVLHNIMEKARQAVPKGH